MATIWTTPSRFVPAPEGIQALLVHIGDEVLAKPVWEAGGVGVRSMPPAIRRNTARRCLAWRPSHVSSMPASAISAHMNCACGGSHGKRSPSAAATPIASGRTSAHEGTRDVTGCPTDSRCSPSSHYSHPRSRNASRSTPGGAYQPSAPYRAPMLNATSLFP